MGRPFSIEASAGLTADAFTVWLEEEVRTSGVDNGYLDDYERAVAGLRTGWSDSNYSVQKHMSHVWNRGPDWWQQYAKEPDDDYLSARIIFNALMQISGSYRNQCYLQANNADQYLALRTSRPHSINMPHTVSQQMERYIGSSGDLKVATIDLEELGTLHEKVSILSKTALEQVCERALADLDFGKAGTPSTDAMKASQINWTKFATGCVIHAAKIREGDLRAVPFLEPKSISPKESDPPLVIYPMREAA